MKDKVLYHIYSFLLGGLARLPLRGLYVLSDGLAWLFMHVIHYRQRVVRSNIQRVFPAWSVQQQQQLECDYYRYLADLFVEILKLLHISDHELDRRVEAHGTELVDEYIREGHPVFILMGHYGNWEWAQQMYTHLLQPTTKHQIFRPLHDKAFGRLFDRMRSRFDSQCIPQKAAVRSMLRLRKEEGAFICTFISDQHPNSELMENWTIFLGQDSAYVTGPEEIGRRLDARYVYLDIERPARGFYRMTCRPVEPVEGESFPYMTGYLRQMEASILRQPELWLWSHRRWYLSHEEYLKAKS